MPPRPNILLLIVEQLAAAWLPAYGHELVHAPNITRHSAAELPASGLDRCLGDLGRAARDAVAGACRVARTGHRAGQEGVGVHASLPGPQVA